MQESDTSQISAFYSNKTIFITGASGYVGTLLAEKLLRSCASLKCLCILFRETKKQKINERLTDYFNDEVFTRMKLENPDYHRQVRILEGDLQREEYGLSAEDKDLLIRQCDVIFHVAATVRFDEHIRVAYDSNVRGTRTLLDLAARMDRLKSFVYVSTAYSNNERSHIEEKVYSPLFTEVELSQLLQASTDEELTTLTPLILGSKANTYTLTKSTAESLVWDAAPFLPVAIMRPSIIMPTLADPIPLYYKGLNALTGLTLAVGTGVMRVQNVVDTGHMDIVPGDRTVNALVALGWYNATIARDGKNMGMENGYEENTNKKNENDKISVRSQPIVFNYVGINDNPITFGSYNQMCLDALVQNRENSSFSIWLAHSVLIQNNILFSFLNYILHLVPCLVFVPLETGWFKKESRLLKLYRKLWLLQDAIAVFMMNEWHFDNENMKAVLASLNEKDAACVDCDLANFEWKAFIEYIPRSLSKYSLNDQVTKETYAKRMYYIELFEEVVCSACAGGLVYAFCAFSATILNLIFYT